MSELTQARIRELSLRAERIAGAILCHVPGHTPDGKLLNKFLAYPWDREGEQRTPIPGYDGWGGARPHFVSGAEPMQVGDLVSPYFDTEVICQWVTVHVQGCVTEDQMLEGIEKALTHRALASPSPRTPGHLLADALNVAEAAEKFNIAYRLNKEKTVSTEVDIRPDAQTLPSSHTAALTHPAPPVTGYRDLTAEEVAIANTFKAKANELGELIEQIRKMPATDGRWLSIGATQIQQGCMAVSRSIFRPKSFA